MSTVPLLNGIWEYVFCTWGRSPSNTEQTKCKDVERAVRKAIDASAKLKTRNIKVFTQGSYANRTNVRQDSDVDICVLCNDVFFTNCDMSEVLDNTVLGFSDAQSQYADFKNDLEAALKSHFGKDSVTRGKKAFDVHANANTYRADADVVPCFEHRHFVGTPQNNRFFSGTRLLSDDGKSIINWPCQNYQNGVDKNNATGRRFKAIVRILKSLRYEMIDNGYTIAKSIPSYLLECLVWNVPNECFGHDEYRADVRCALAHLCNETRADGTCKEWGEINDLKYLFRQSQSWTRKQVNEFLNAAWTYIGFK